MQAQLYKNSMSDEQNIVSRQIGTNEQSLMYREYLRTVKWNNKEVISSRVLVVNLGFSMCLI